jgi:GT2 family glycosyltransferase
MCLISLVKHTEFPYKVLILNNDGSEMGVQAMDQEIAQFQYEGFKLHHMGGNKGWMGAINAGMEHVDTPYVCLMNDDVVFPDNARTFWRALIRHLGPDSEVGAVGPSSNFVAGAQSLFRLDTPPSIPTKYLIGFCMVLRTDIFRQVGLLDENLPGGDDLDLSIRIRKAGYRLVIDREAYVHHIGCQTGGKLYGNYWNSLEQQDATNNALMRKHGVSEWYDCVDERPFSRADHPDIDEALSLEDRWVKKMTTDAGQGVNVGCGDDYREGMINVDKSQPGETGAGGRKFTGVKSDITADATSIPLDTGTIDFVLARHLFEHILDPIACLEEWRRLLKPGGKIILVCPNHGTGNSMIIDYTHVHGYTSDSLRNLLRITGFH